MAGGKVRKKSYSVKTHYVKIHTGMQILSLNYNLTIMNTKADQILTRREDSGIPNY